jgi:DNA-binding IclR family transcriptional regulator
VGPASQAIMALLPQDEANAIIEANAALYARYHGVGADKIRDSLPQIRERHYALDHGEL